MSYLKAWLIFTNERFNPLSHFTMLALFVFFHFSFIFHHSFESIDLLVQVTFFCFIFYFKLRLYDEIKDYDTDLIVNPHRPLPRGLLKIRDAQWGILLCLVAEHLVLINQSIETHVFLIIIQIYSLIMFKEFFIGNFLRPHLTTYAILHTFITFLITLFILYIFSNNQLIQNQFIIIALNNWILFNIFEFGRKTFATTEEKKDVDSYSSIFSPKGAVALQSSQVLFNLGILYYLYPKKTIFHLQLFAVLCLFAILSILYIKMNNQYYARRYRIFSEIYIVLVLTIMTINNYI